LQRGLTFDWGGVDGGHLNYFMGTNALYAGNRHIWHLIKFGLAYRGHGTNESLYNLRNPCRNHGNFLEIIKTFSEHNELLQKHLDLKSVQSGKNAKMKEMKFRKDGSLRWAGYISIKKFWQQDNRCHSQRNEIHDGG